jgi:hypothetical protein
VRQTVLLNVAAGLVVAGQRPGMIDGPLTDRLRASIDLAGWRSIPGRQRACPTAGSPLRTSEKAGRIDHCGG